MTFIKEQEEYVNNILKDLGYFLEDFNILPSSKRELGSFQLNIAMSLAKKYHKNPMEIAKEIVEKLMLTLLVLDLLIFPLKNNFYLII